VFINTVDANTGYTADVAMDRFICQGANAGYTADAAMHSYICQTQDCSYSSTHFHQQLERRPDITSTGLETRYKAVPLGWERPAKKGKQPCKRSVGDPDVYDEALPHRKRHARRRKDAPYQSTPAPPDMTFYPRPQARRMSHVDATELC
jgi:hypothetical protein